MITCLVAGVLTYCGHTTYFYPQATQLRYVPVPQYSDAQIRKWEQQLACLKDYSKPVAYCRDQK